MLFRIDAEKGDGKELAKKWKVNAYPSFILFNSKGEPLDRWLGYEKSFFLKTFTDAIKDQATIDEMVSRMKSKPDVADASALGRWYSAFGDFKKAVEYYTESQKLNSDPSFDYTDEIFEVVADGYLKNIYTFEDVKAAADNVVRSKNETPSEVYEACQRMITLVVDKNQLELLPGYIKGGLQATSDTTKPEMKQGHNEMMIYEALFINKDTTKAVTYKKGSMPDGWTENALQLNEFAWWCFANKVNLPEAETLSKKSVGLAEAGNDKAQCLDTNAEIANALGKPNVAVELTKQAIAQDSTSDYYPKQLDRFEKLVNPQKP